MEFIKFYHEKIEIQEMINIALTLDEFIIILTIFLGFTLIFTMFLSTDTGYQFLKRIYGKQ